MNARVTPSFDPATAPSPLLVDVAIIGAGFGGLCMAIQLLKNGNDRFVVLEKAAEVGGTWRDNSYPGAACDVQSHMYSFSFAGKADWSQRYAPWQRSSSTSSTPPTPMACAATFVPTAWSAAPVSTRVPPYGR